MTERFVKCPFDTHKCMRGTCKQSPDDPDCVRMLRLHLVKFMPTIWIGRKATGDNKRVFDTFIKTAKDNAATEVRKSAQSFGIEARSYSRAFVGLVDREVKR